MLSIFSLFFLCLYPFSLLAQDLTLHDVIQDSKTGSLQIQKAESAYKEARWKKRETYSGFLPTLKGEINYLTDKKYMLVDMNFSGSDVTIPQILPTTQYSLKAFWPIFDGFASTNRYLSGEALEDAAQREFEWTQFSVSRQAILQFYRALGARILKDVTEQNLKTLNDHLKDVLAYRKAGVSTQYDVLRVEVQVSEAQSEILSAEDSLQLAQYKLGEVMGKEVEVRNPTGELPVLKESLIKNLNYSALTRKDLQALKQKVDAALYAERSANRYWIPRVTLVGGYDHYNNRNNRFNDDDAFRDSYQVGINLTWNMFDGFAATSKSGAAEEQAVQVDRNFQMAQIKARQDFEFWKRKYLYYCNVYQFRTQDVSRSTEAVRLARVGRKAGTRTNTELLDAESELFKARAGQVNAQLGAVEALINLELASGTKLYDFN